MFTEYSFTVLFYFLTFNPMLACATWLTINLRTDQRQLFSLLSVTHSMKMTGLHGDASQLSSPLWFILDILCLQQQQKHTHTQRERDRGTEEVE